MNQPLEHAVVFCGEDFAFVGYQVQRSGVFTAVALSANIGEVCVPDPGTVVFADILEMAVS
jgi:hypothetical protein